MKKKGDGAAGQQSADYMVGQVSGSLFPESCVAPGSSLSALFSAAGPAAPVLFQPAPEVSPAFNVFFITQRIPEGKQPQSAEVKGQLSLQTADEDEQESDPKKTTKKIKSEGAEAGGENSTEHWAMKRQKLRARKEDEAQKRKRTVFVGNLPVSCTKKMLQSLFRDKGPIESIRFRSVVREDPSMSRKVAVIQRKVHPKKQSMNAYVVFKDEGGVEKALERNGMEIQKDFHIRVDRVGDSSSHDHRRSIFVGNLSFEINELTLRQHFEECGCVEAVRVVRDQNSGLGKGFGYVLFEGADAVQLALKLDGTKLEGRSIRVKRSVKKEKQKKKTVAGGPARGPKRGAGPDRGGRPRGFKSPKTFPGRRLQMATTSSASYSGEKVDRKKNTKKKGRKKTVKANKTVHI
uniref:RRM domain-containing protein n=1 Tax=Mola mola TaxID=94237 RepID=A0A3Q4BSZ2_MOLML